MNRDPSSIFLDTAYVIARTNTRDQWYARATHWDAWLRRERRRLVTTELIRLEIGDGLASVRLRQYAVGILELLRTDADVDVVPASSALFADALALYRARPDQAWGLTDRASFAVMRERGLTAALTADDHFRQAGFRALLLDDPSV